MPISEILMQIDAEIARLKQVRNILAGKPPASNRQESGRVSLLCASQPAKFRVDPVQ
jgi:hypothetical protein